MPRRPTLGFTSPAASSVPETAALSPVVVLRGSVRCWMIVLLTANLYLLPSLASEGSLEEEVSEMRAWRMLLMMALFQDAVLSWW
jgi:hypothetical protein